MRNADGRWHAHDWIDMNANLTSATPPSAFITAHLPRIKSKAKQLSTWTGLPLSKCLEIAATALGATSWQALLKNPRFIPDDAYPGIDEPPARIRALTYKDMKQRLDKTLSALMTAMGVGPEMASFVLRQWQPGAMHPMLKPHWDHCLPEDEGSMEVKHLFEDVPGVPQGFVLALCAVSYFKHTLQLVSRPHLARYVRQTDTVPIGIEQMSGRLQELWKASEPHFSFGTSYRCGLVQKHLAQGDLTFSEGIKPLQTPAPKLKASWLKGPRDVRNVLALGAQKIRWNKEDYPGLRPASKDKVPVWCMHLPEFSMEVAITDQGIRYIAYVPGKHYLLQGCNVDETGSIHHFRVSSERGWDKPKEGWHLCEHGDRIFGSPLPGVDEAMARSIRKKVGMLDFKNSEAGLACAKWVATYPERFESFCLGMGRNSSTYVTMPSVKQYGLAIADRMMREHAQRIEFELIGRGHLV